MNRQLNVPVPPELLAAVKATASLESVRIQDVVQRALLAELERAGVAVVRFEQAPPVTASV